MLHFDIHPFLNFSEVDQFRHYSIQEPAGGMVVILKIDGDVQQEQIEVSRQE